MKVKDLLSDASAWTRGTMARDKSGKPCDPRDDRAVQFCLVGAIRRVYRGWGERMRAYDDVSRVIGNTIIEYWNDAPDRTFLDVLRVLEKADV
jgi:hypothetical protein